MNLDNIKELSIEEATDLYNAVLQRNTKKVGMKSDAIRAISSFLEDNEAVIEDYLPSIPTDLKFKCNKLGILDLNYDPAYRFMTPIGVGEYMRRLIKGPMVPGSMEIQGIEDPDEILRQLYKAFPQTKSTRGDVAYIKTQLRKQGFIIPKLKRKK